MVLAGLLLVAPGCGSDDGDEAAGDDASASVDAVDLTGSDTVDIGVVDNNFEPPEFRVDPGAEIVFTNTGEDQHNVTPADEGAFTGIDEEDLGTGDSASIVIDEPGTYVYYCSLHGTPNSGQNGVIIVGSD